MKFINGHLYHVYNQGNDKCRVFFSIENYRFFIIKIKKHILPYADIIAFGLMPNHFHLLLFVKEDIVPELLNHNLGILLRSYTRAINVQKSRSGSLFRQGTKSKELFDWDDIHCSDDNYLQTCFDYIHNNPVKAGLVFKEEDWIYSSAKIYKFKTKSNLVNTQMAKELQLI
jgi:putative transposase